MMCASCDRLRAELREVKEELEEWRNSERDSSIGGEAALIAKAMKISPQPARIIFDLMSAPSRIVGHSQLIETMAYGGEGRDIRETGKTDEGNALKVVIAHARRGLESVGLFDAIGSVRGVGYIMPKSKADDIKRLLEAS